MKRAFPILLAALAAGCEPAPLPPSTPAPPLEPAPPASSAPAAPPGPLDVLGRLEFNRLAAELDLPLFWIADAGHPGTLDPDELAVLWGIAPGSGPWLDHGAFTPAFHAAYASMVKARAEGTIPAGLDDAEKRRRAAVVAELGQGRPSLIRTDLRGASPEDQALAARVIEAARIIERIFAKQRGTADLAAEVASGEAASRMLFYRNQGPWCEQPKTDKDPDCNALARRPARVSGLYPASLQKEPKFCEKLDARPDQKALLGPFTVVAEKGADLEAVPYSVAFKQEMEAVSRELAAAAQAITSPGEGPLKAYLDAAAKAFLDNNWEPADEAWAKMGVNNSRWYLRIGPDETYADPCSRKAGFHVSFARINQDSIAWQKRLEPVKSQMEAALAGLAGAPYKARSVTFHLPDFIDVVLNAGDSRNATGATIGQSLPNWGPVANEGRGRTVAMTNLYTDPDSRAALREEVDSLFCKGAIDPEALDPALTVMGTVLHEAAHNLGPAHEYKVKGKTDTETFGGPLAATFEELKAQTSSLYLAQWLADQKIIDKKMAALAHQSDIVWAFGQISQGMYAADNTPKPYAQLASIQVGWLLERKAMTYREGEPAANGRDKGCFEIHLGKVPAAVAALERAVLGIKGRGDKPGAVKMREALVDKDGEWKKLRGVIAERWLRTPKASFVYAVEL
jgi:hypothetical protein